MSQLYFAYGSNLNLKDLREFEKRNGIFFSGKVEKGGNHD